MYDGDYIERLLSFEKPLTSHFRKTYVEFLALEILQYCYGDFYKKFNIYDSPDLCGMSGDTELFEKPSNINGFRGQRAEIILCLTAD